MTAKHFPEQLIAGYQRFRTGYLHHQRAALNRLAAGQAPYVAMIACCDSRVDPTIIFDASLGELFVVRNVANLVPPYEKDSAFHGTSAALEFAVSCLQVKHIVVLGHAGCGGIHALMNPGIDNSGSSFISRWMSIADRARRTVLARDDLVDMEARLAACEKAAVHLSLNNLLSYPWISQRLAAGKLSIHGWFYDLAAAELLCYQPRTGRFEKVPVPLSDHG